MSGCYFCPLESVTEAFGRAFCEGCLTAYMAARSPDPRASRSQAAPKTPKAKREPKGKYGTGTVHGCWTVLGRGADCRHRRVKCRECGAEREMHASSLVGRAPKRCLSCMERTGPGPYVYTVGSRHGTMTVTGPSSDGRRYPVRCDCGKDWARLSVSLARKPKGCQSCKWQARGRVVTACRHCGARLVRSPHNAKHASCEACKAKKAAASGLASKKRSRVATKGRVCLGCGATDAEKAWGRHLLCEACDRAGCRNGWAPCGAPLWKGRNGGGRPFVCRAHGADCNESQAEAS